MGYEAPYAGMGSRLSAPQRHTRNLRRDLDHGSSHLQPYHTCRLTYMRDSVPLQVGENSLESTVFTKPILNQTCRETPLPPSSHQAPPGSHQVPLALPVLIGVRFVAAAVLEVAGGGGGRGGGRRRLGNPVVPLMPNHRAMREQSLQASKIRFRPREPARDSQTHSWVRSRRSVPEQLS